MILKNRVKELRARHNWSQSDLGERVGVTRQTIASIERGDYSPSLLLGLLIAKVFGLAAEEIFHIEDEEANE